MGCRRAVGAVVIIICDGRSSAFSRRQRVERLRQVVRKRTQEGEGGGGPGGREGPGRTCREAACQGGRGGGEESTAGRDAPSRRSAAAAQKKVRDRLLAAKITTIITIHDHDAKKAKVHGRFHPASCRSVQVAPLCVPTESTKAASYPTGALRLVPLRPRLALVAIIIVIVVLVVARERSFWNRQEKRWTSMHLRLHWLMILLHRSSIIIIIIIIIGSSKKNKKKK